MWRINMTDAKIDVTAKLIFQSISLLLLLFQQILSFNDIIYNKNIRDQLSLIKSV